MARVYITDGTGITYEAVGAVYIGDLVELDNDGKIQQATTDSNRVIGVVSGSNYKGVLKADGTARTKDKIEIGESAAVRCVGEVLLHAKASGHNIVPGCRVKAYTGGKVVQWTPSDEADEIVGKATSAVDANGDVKVILY